MKRILRGWIMLALITALVACNKSTAASNNNQDTVALSTEGELVVGTFKLEGTAQAVTAAQAKQLLPLWQTLQTLSTSSTAATEEVNALLDQIKSTLTTQQIEQITAMKLTQKDMMTVMADAGVGFGGAQGTPNATQQGNQFNFPAGGQAPSGGSGSSTGGGPSGGMPSGGMPSGGGAPPSGGFVTQGNPGGPGSMPGQSSTPQAVRGNGFSSQVPAPLLNALIQMLQKKVQ